MLQQVVEAVELGLVLLGSERLVVPGDQAGYVAVFGLDDLLGGDAFLVLLAQFVSNRIGRLGGVELVLRRAADEGDGIGEGNRRSLG